MIKEMNLEELRRWLEDKTVTRRIRVLVLLFEEFGDGLSFDEIALDINADRSGVYRLLHHLKIEGLVKYKKEDKIFKWSIRELGENRVCSLRKKGLAPIRKDGLSLKR